MKWSKLAVLARTVWCVLIVSLGVISTASSAMNRKAHQAAWAANDYAAILNDLTAFKARGAEPSQAILLYLGSQLGVTTYKLDDIIAALKTKIASSGASASGASASGSGSTGAPASVPAVSSAAPTAAPAPTPVSSVPPVASAIGSGGGAGTATGSGSGVGGSVAASATSTGSVPAGAAEAFAKLKKSKQTELKRAQQMKRRAAQDADSSLPDLTQEEILTLAILEAINSGELTGFTATVTPAAPTPAAVVPETPPIAAAVVPETPPIAAASAAASVPSVPVSTPTPASAGEVPEWVGKALAGTEEKDNTTLLAWLKTEKGRAAIKSLQSQKITPEGFAKILKLMRMMPAIPPGWLGNQVLKYPASEAIVTQFGGVVDVSADSGGGGGGGGGGGAAAGPKVYTPETMAGEFGTTGLPWIDGALLNVLNDPNVKPWQKKLITKSLVEFLQMAFQTALHGHGAVVFGWRKFYDKIIENKLSPIGFVEYAKAFYDDYESKKSTMSVEAIVKALAMKDSYKAAPGRQAVLPTTTAYVMEEPLKAGSGSAGGGSAGMSAEEQAKQAELAAARAAASEAEAELYKILNKLNAEIDKEVQKAVEKDFDTDEDALHSELLLKRLAIVENGQTLLDKLTDLIDTHKKHFSAGLIAALRRASTEGSQYHWYNSKLPAASAPPASVPASSGTVPVASAAPAPAPSPVPVAGSPDGSGPVPMASATPDSAKAEFIPSSVAGSDQPADAPAASVTPPAASTPAGTPVPPIAIPVATPAPAPSVSGGGASGASELSADEIAALDKLNKIGLRMERAKLDSLLKAEQAKLENMQSGRIKPNLADIALLNTKIAKLTAKLAYIAAKSGLG